MGSYLVDVALYGVHDWLIQRGVLQAPACSCEMQDEGFAAHEPFSLIHLSPHTLTLATAGNLTGIYSQKDPNPLPCTRTKI